jgi:hypothetical protein
MRQYKIIKATYPKLIGVIFEYAILKGEMNKPPKWFSEWSKQVYEERQPKWFSEWTSEVYEKRQPQWFTNWSTEFEKRNDTRFERIELTIHELKDIVEYNVQNGILKRPR